MAYTNIDDPSAHFQAFTYTGNQSSRDITLDGNSDLQPDLYWYKARNSNHHYWVDSSRGTTKYIYSSLNNAEATVASAYVTSFNTNGFNVGGGDSGTNASGISFANWAWKANGGTTSSNTDGTITSTVQANTDAGFSIVTYTAADGDETVGHGLGVAPKVVIVKRRDSGASWAVHLSFLTSSNKQLYLDSTMALDTNNIGSVGASTFRVYGWQGTAVANGTYVAYCFAEKQGYSKFSSYVGNGNVNGPFVYTGFKPAWVMVKQSNTARSWQIFDNKRDGYNKDYMPRLQADNNSAEAANTGASMDFVSNGFKIRTDQTGANQSGGTYIYMAFAENPFVTSTGIPTTAR